MFSRTRSRLERCGQLRLEVERIIDVELVIARSCEGPRNGSSWSSGPIGRAVKSLWKIPPQARS